MTSFSGHSNFSIFSVYTLRQRYKRDQQTEERETLKAAQAHTTLADFAVQCVPVRARVRSLVIVCVCVSVLMSSQSTVEELSSGIVGHHRT